MRVAKLTRWGFVLGVGLSLALTGCGGPPAAVDAGDGAAAPTATAGPAVPANVPVMASAYDLAVTADGTYIAYKAPETYPAAVEYYQAELVSQGWEKLNKNDAEFGGSTTLLRTRPEANISVTIQEVPGDDNAVRVLISLSLK
jgi:hypothetical protein